ARYRLPVEDIQRLVKTYGVQVENVLAYAEGNPEAAQIEYAAGHEMVMHLRDLLCISTTWGYERQWDDGALMSTARRLGGHLGWNQEQLRREVDWAAPEIHSLSN
ncbi:MAG: glycerol-3-phosphate dehydrogenase C-terminal domain-containing protein, partial [Bryobacteraceae bacterium]